MRFQTISDVIAALKQSASDVVAAKIDYDSGYGAFGGLDKYANGGAYRFRALNIQFGNQQFAGECMRRIAQEIGAGQTEGSIGMHRWYLTEGEPEEFQSSDAAQESAEAAPETQNQPEPDLAAAASPESKNPETAKNKSDAAQAPAKLGEGS